MEVSTIRTITSPFGRAGGTLPSELNSGKLKVNRRSFLWYFPKYLSAVRSHTPPAGSEEPSAIRKSSPRKVTSPGKVLTSSKQFLRDNSPSGLLSVQKTTAPPSPSASVQLPLHGDVVSLPHAATCTSITSTEVEGEREREREDLEFEETDFFSFYSHGDDAGRSEEQLSFLSLREESMSLSGPVLSLYDSARILGSPKRQFLENAFHKADAVKVSGFTVSEISPTNLHATNVSERISDQRSAFDGASLDVASRYKLQQLRALSSLRRTRRSESRRSLDRTRTAVKAVGGQQISAKPESAARQNFANLSASTDTSSWGHSENEFQKREGRSRILSASFGSVKGRRVGRQSLNSRLEARSGTAQTTVGRRSMQTNTFSARSLRRSASPIAELPLASHMLDERKSAVWAPDAPIVSKSANLTPDLASDLASDMVPEEPASDVAGSNAPLDIIRHALLLIPISLSEAEDLNRRFGWCGCVAQMDFDTKLPLLTSAEEKRLSSLVKLGREFEKRRTALEEATGRAASPEEWRRSCDCKSVKELEWWKTLSGAARTKLVLSNLRLVLRQCHSLLSRSPFSSSPLSFSELSQHGLKGLLSASLSYDPDRNVRFSTYASYSIRNHLLKALGAASSIKRGPDYISMRFLSIGKARAELRAELGRTPSHAEVAARAKMSLSQFKTVVRHFSREKSFESPVVGGSGGGSGVAEGKFLFGEVVGREAEEENPLGVLDPRLRLAMDEMIDTLKPREGIILRQRFGLDGKGERSQAEIGSNLNLSRNSVQEIETAALAKLKHPARQNYLRQYFTRTL